MTSSASPTEHPASSGSSSSQQQSCAHDPNLMPSDLQQFELMNTLGLGQSASNSQMDQSPNNEQGRNNSSDRDPTAPSSVAQQLANGAGASNGGDSNGNSNGNSNANGNGSGGHNSNSTPTGSMPPSSSSSSSAHGMIPGVGDAALQLGSQDFFSALITTTPGPSSSSLPPGAPPRLIPDHNGMSFWPPGTDPRFMAANFANMNPNLTSLPGQMSGGSGPATSIPSSAASMPPNMHNHAQGPLLQPPFPRGTNMPWQSQPQFPFNGTNTMAPGIEQAPYPFGFSIKTEAESPVVQRTIENSYSFQAQNGAGGANGGGQMMTPFRGSNHIGNGQQQPMSAGPARLVGRGHPHQHHQHQQPQIPSQASPTGRAPSNGGPVFRFGMPMNPNHHHSSSTSSTINNHNHNNTHINHFHHPSYSNLDTALSPFSPSTTSSATTLVGSISSSAAGSPAKRRASEMGSEMMLGSGNGVGGGQHSQENSLEGAEDDSLDLSYSIGAISTDTAASGSGGAANSSSTSSAAATTTTSGGLAPSSAHSGGRSSQGSTSALPMTDYGSAEYQHRKDVVRKRRLNSEARRRTELQEHFESLRQVLARDINSSSHSNNGSAHHSAHEARVVKSALLQRAIEKLSTDQQNINAVPPGNGGAGDGVGGLLSPSAMMSMGLGTGMGMGMGMGMGVGPVGSFGGGGTMMMGNPNFGGGGSVGGISPNGQAQAQAQAQAQVQAFAQAQQQHQQRFGVVRSPRHQNAALQQMTIQQTGAGGGGINGGGPPLQNSSNQMSVQANGP
ncbi:unnamed protein product [Tilletia caries]|nr:unnamed protein product [Tilletia caries]